MQEVNTQKYWEVSSVWNDRPLKKRKTPMSVTDAIHGLSTVVNSSKSTKPLIMKAGNLLNEIIHNAEG